MTKPTTKPTTKRGVAKAQAPKELQDALATKLTEIAASVVDDAYTKSAQACVTLAAERVSRGDVLGASAASDCAKMILLLRGSWR